MPATRAKAKSRSEVGEFLRDRRAKLTPADVGLVSRGARRTPGLRREELAAIAGVSVTWYTWLEQGRDVQVSRDVLSRIAKAFRLTKTERSHLFALTQENVERDPPPSLGAGLPLSMVRLLASFDSIPAYVTEDVCWNVLGQSRAADVLYRFSSHPPSTRNVLRILFGESSLRSTLLNWREVAEDTVARFRHATAAHHGDARRLALVEELSLEHAEFRTIWERLDVRERVVGTKSFQIPRIGVLDFEHHAFTSHARDDVSLVIYSLRSEGDGAAKLRQLVGRTAARPRRRRS